MQWKEKKEKFLSSFEKGDDSLWEVVRILAGRARENGGEG
jgi:hypothetical protein